jgi:hypothetical protein
MSGISTLAAQALLAGLFGDGRQAPAPAAWHVALSSTLPALSAGVISGVTEPSAGGYARVTVANTTANWAGSGRTVANTAAIVFPALTAPYDVMVAHWVLYDPTGEPHAHGPITGAFTLSTGSVPVLAAGTAAVTINE